MEKLGHDGMDDLKNPPTQLDHGQPVTKARCHLGIPTSRKMFAARSMGVEVWIRGFVACWHWFLPLWWCPTGV